MLKRSVIAIVAASLALAGCASRQEAGTGIGAATGAIIGSQFGGGVAGRLGATLVGAAVGGLIGNAIGRDLDREARQRAYEAEYAAFNGGSRQEWRTARAYGYVEPRPVYRRGPTFCREYAHTIFIGGQPQTAVGTACQNPDGTWTPVS